MERAEMGEKNSLYILCVSSQEEECWVPAVMGTVRQLGTRYIQVHPKQQEESK